MAVIARTRNAISMLLRLGASVNAKTTHGDTVFTRAMSKHVDTTGRWSSANSRTFDCARFLIQAGPDVSIRNNTGENALWVITAFWPKNDEHVLAFLEELLSKADLQTINAITTSKTTILYNAVYAASPGAVKVLLKYGAFPDGAFADRPEHGPVGGSPLSFAASLPFPDVAQVLLAAGANPNYQAPLTKRTPFHWASSYSVEVVKSLLQYRADARIPDFDGWAPLHHAASADQAAIVQRLLEHDHTCLDIKDRNGKTPLDLAIVSRANQSISVILSFIFENKLKISEDSQARISDMFSRPTNPKDLIDIAESIDHETSSAVVNATVQKTPYTTTKAFHPNPTEIQKALTILLHLLSQHPLYRLSSHTPHYNNPSYPHSSTNPNPESSTSHRPPFPPSKIPSLILHHASYHHHIHFSRQTPLTTTANPGMAPYLSIYPLPSLSPPLRVSKIIFHITSHDQGWSDYHSDHCTYRNSSSFFYVLKTPRGRGMDMHGGLDGVDVDVNDVGTSDEDTKASERGARGREKLYLCANRHATSEYKEKIMVFEGSSLLTPTASQRDLNGYND